MKTLWNRLRPEYKHIIDYYIEEGNYTVGPQATKKSLEENHFFGQLTVDQLQQVFIWTDNDVIDIKWQDLYGDRFLTEEKNK
jgi:hypothetical protein